MVCSIITINCEIFRAFFFSFSKLNKGLSISKIKLKNFVRIADWNCEYLRGCFVASYIFEFIGLSCDSVYARVKLWNYLNFARRDFFSNQMNNFIHSCRYYFCTRFPRINILVRLRGIAITTERIVQYVLFQHISPIELYD